MKRWSSTLLSGLFLLGAVTLPAQQQPVMTVDITAITVYTGGEVENINLVDGGSGYTSAPTVVISSPGGSGATAQATAIVDLEVHSVSIISGGAGYTETPIVEIRGGGATIDASAVAIVENGRVTAIVITDGGEGYTSAPQINFIGGGGAGAAAAAELSGRISDVVVTNPGSGYLAPPSVQFEGGGGSGATAFAALTGIRYSPPNERSGPAGTTIGITARAVGTFVRDSFRYSFFVNGISIGRTPDPVPPPLDCTVAWTPPQPGFYFLTVEADDGANKAMSLPVRFFATGTVVNSPTPNTIVPNGSSVVLKADSTVGGGFIRSIQFFDNGVPIGEPDATIPYSLIYTPPGGPGTVHNITAVATDNDFTLLPASSPVRLNVVNSIAPLPRSAITSPAHNSAVAIPTGAEAYVPIVVDASSASGIVSKVELYIDGVLFGTSSNYPYSFNWQPKVVGVYRLVALTYDDKNNVVASTTSAGPTSTPRPTIVTVETQTSETVITAKVYRGTYTAASSGGTSLPTVAVHRDNNNQVTLIAFSGGASPQINYLEDVELASDGAFTVYNGANTVAAGQVSSTGASGTFDNGQATFIAPLITGSSAYQGSGRLSGSIVGKAGSVFTGIVAPDGGLTIYVRDGTTVDAGHGLIRSTGAFEFPTVRGGLFKGQIGAGGGLLSGTLSNGPVTGQVTASFTATTPASSDGFLMNLSTRGPVGSGDRQLIAGFVVSGESPKQVLIRGVGPTLSAFGVSGAVAEPSLALFNSDRQQIAFNKQWNNNPAIKAASAHAGAFQLPDSSRDSSLIQTLAPGAYSVQMNSNGAPGVGLIEIYDLDLLDAYASKRVLNVSTRGEVGQGDKIIIAGLNISGTKPKRVLVRGVGPTLGAFGVAGAVNDPVLQLFQGATMIRENDNWDTGSDAEAIRTISGQVGAFALPEGSKDAVLLITLPPGAYTAQVSGARGATGIALVEVYEVD